MKKSKLALFQSVVSLLLCISMLMGTTFAWFTDSVTSGNNIIKTGNLKIGMDWADGTQAPETAEWKDASQGAIFNYELWEPGYTEVRHIRIENKGSLALKYQLKIIANGEVSNLADVIDVYYTQPAQQITLRTQLTESMKLGTLTEVLGSLESNANGHLLANESVTLTLALKMQESAGNEYQNKSIGANFSVVLLATQYTSEDDSFDEFYDKDADFDFPENSFSESVTENVDVADGKVTQDTTIQGATTSAVIPEGVQVNDGINALTVSVSDLESSNANITLGENEAIRPLDVHIEGIADDNTVPMEITIKEAAAKGLNAGNLKLYHVENGVSNEMTAVDTFTAHNQFKYDPATGDITLYMATFSEVALVADTENAWNGTVATAFGGAGTEADPYIIANADQLAYLNEVISNENDTYGSAYYKLITDINLGGEENANNNILFYPIGYHKEGGTIATVDVDDAPESYYIIEEDTKTPGSAVAEGDTTWYTYGGSFKGTFDGAGHKISNIYQNTWQLKGNYSGNYWNAAMGLFGYVNGGKVKNLTVDNFTSDGEFTPTGVIAAYAANSTFENIAITNCNPRVYNTGNGGIVGIGGNSDDPDSHKLTFTNITIDNTNKISALWGSWDVACGGLVGMFRGAGHVYMTNCHVAAQIDVFNDVCGNYQYYWYRYAGMMVGTNKNMITDANGYTVPETDKFHAENCTVHFGEWNDYYYCELVANSLASYTHDHQFSRLTEISSLDEIKSGDTWTKTGNFLLISGATKTCYHIVEKNGTKSQHLHTDAGEETVNGETVLKEDKQIVYLPFNQLFTGYGWGVKHIPVYNGEDYAFEGITILDREVADSVEKFSSNVTELTNNQTIKLGDIFTYVDNDVALVPGALTVTVTSLDENNPVSATINYDKENWENGTLTLTGTGMVKITIQDYYFCTPTTIEVNVTDRQPEQKFESKFTGDFLYRVGNKNTVSLGSLFAAKDGVQIGVASATIENVSGNAAGTYTSNAEWAKGTIQFSGTGVVKVTIKDDDEFCTPIVLYLEVVDAVNATTATNATSNNVVLLNNVPSAGSLTVANGYIFYGNGFELAYTGDGSYRSAALSYGFVTVENGGILDNVQVKCKIYPESYLYTSEMKADSNERYPYGYSAVVVSGNSTISNSYIYGARNNILVTTGNVTIKNTVTENGSLANIHIKSSDAYVVTLEDVATIQKLTQSTIGESKNVLGFGILVGDNESESNAQLKLAGQLNQDNWVTAETANEVSNTYAKTAIKSALNVDAYKHTNNNGETTINLGIAYLNEKAAAITDERIDKDNLKYVLNTISMSGYSGQVYSVSGGSVGSDEDTNKPIGNTDVLPTVVFADHNGGSLNLARTFVETEQRWIDRLNVDLDNISGGSYVFKFSDIAVQKYGTNLEFTIKDPAGKVIEKDTQITLQALSQTEYTLLVRDNQIYGADGKPTGTIKDCEMPFILAATKTSIEPPKFTNAGTATAIRLVEKAGGDWRPAYTVLTGISVTYWSALESKVNTVDLSTVYNSGTISSNVWTYSCDDYTLTITGGAVHSDGTTITPVVSNNTLYFASTNKAFGTGTTSRSIILTYVFTDKNASTTWNRSETVTYSNLSEYDYNSFKDNGTLAEPSSGGSCVTPDTLITLTDGTQVRVDSLTGSEQLLVWNMETGKLDSAPIMFVDSDPNAEYEIVHLYFSDGTDVKIIYEHGFWDYDLNRYVYLDANAEQFIGHTFAKQNGDKLEKVQLVDVAIEKEYTTAWSPVTEGHLCYFVNGMLSMPGGVGGLFNIFDVDSKTMTYDLAAMQRDIETYGLYTYEELNALCPLSEEMFHAAGGAYLKVSIGKGNLTVEELIAMINRYSKFF